MSQVAPCVRGLTRPCAAHQSCSRAVGSGSFAVPLHMHPAAALEQGKQGGHLCSARDKFITAGVDE